MFVLRDNSSTYVQFRTAIANREIDEAFCAARALDGLLSLLDALELVLLAAEDAADDQRGRSGPRPPSEGKTFETCAARWVARVTVERELLLPEMLHAAKTLQAAGRGQSENAYRELAGLL